MPRPPSVCRSCALRQGPAWTSTRRNGMPACRAIRLVSGCSCSFAVGHLPGGSTIGASFPIGRSDQRPPVNRFAMPPLSVLDLSPVTTGGSGRTSLKNTLDLALLADRLGYVRYWVAEHHNLPSIASSAPEIMIGQIAALTQHIRVGAGGVMLPNHAPLMVVERFKILEALFPNRIDLGIGRAPGTDQITSIAL